ncbi:isoprenylcysteine carboxylmethyltransferase family protein [Sphingosinicella sp. LHD-64]|uniref:methanethiol S-methyltransferase n=1 Tax=Sphingosinicella sp. LHD-64 TaxID=3072139 RepID=UPI0028101EFC|nr:methanethiol S-methyltransferase [Sphingosinicella sp. LHD-64]MDQ8757712.1 isoprenylcysteine carboxylmethyltransferase family protein [Sphingosinicella sp. LHD-64]
MARGLYLLFALLAYAIFFATFLYLIGFVGNLPGPPRTVDRGPESTLAVALAVNVALIALFGLQHSVMARRGFKRAWTRVVPEPIERSVYVLIASLTLILLFVFWRPIPAQVWHVENAAGAAILWALFGVGWLIVLLSTFLINHFELFGLQQVYLHARGREAAPPRFRMPFFYRAVRHPLYSGFLLAFWATPVMSVGHLLLAAGVSIYMLIAIRYEERDLIHLFGDDYDNYRREVGMLTPKLRRRA